MGRKFWLGVGYLFLGFGVVGFAVWKGDSGLVGATAAACGTMAGGLAAVVWGNVQEHRAAKNGAS